MENKTKKAQETLQLINEVLKIIGHIIVLIGLISTAVSSISTAYKIRNSKTNNSGSDSDNNPDKENFVEAYGECKEDSEYI